MRERLATDIPGDVSWALPPSRRDRWRAALYVASAGSLIALVLLAVGFGQVAATGVLVIAFLSFILAYLVAPVAERLRSLTAARRAGRAVSRAVATLAVYALIGAVVAPLWALEGPRFTAALGRMRVLVPEHTARFVGQLRASERWHESAGLPVTLSAAVGSVTRVMTRSLEREARAVGAELVDIRGLVPWLLAVPALSFLLLTRWRSFRRSTARVLPTPHLRWRVDQFLRNLNQVLAAYTRAQALSARCAGSGSRYWASSIPARSGWRPGCSRWCRWPGRSSLPWWRRRWRRIGWWPRSPSSGCCASPRTTSSIRG